MGIDVSNVAIFPSEAENALELFRALNYAPRFKIIGLASKEGHASFAFEHYRTDIPYIDDANFLEEFSRILIEEKIKYIFPTHDSVALFLKENENLLPAKILCSEVNTAKLCKYKNLLYDFFEKEDFCPKIFKKEEINASTNLPIFVKPSQGQGGQGCKKISNIKQLNEELAFQDGKIFCEYLPGKEYTVDCFTDRHRQLLFAGARSRDRVKMGISFSTKNLCIEKDKEIILEIEEIAAKINAKIHLHGLWFFQVKADSKGKLKLLEISTRVATSMSLFRQNGINFALMSLYDALQMDLKLVENQGPIRKSRFLASTYKTNITYDAVYIDLDDTLIVRDKVNLLAINFLYQCVNEQKEIILITRHEGDIATYLEKFCIHTSLFSEIIHIKDASKKSSFITKKDAIFIDNLFVERLDVKKMLNIPVFDVDAIESLIKIK